MTKIEKPSRRDVLKYGAAAATTALCTPYVSRAWAQTVEINMLAWYGHGEPDMVGEFEGKPQRFGNLMTFLEIVPNEKLVFTDGYLPGWEPNPNAFFTAVVTFETLPDGKTRYTARAMHWTAEAKEKHAAMGFLDGWGAAFDQLVELSR